MNLAILIGTVSSEVRRIDLRDGVSVTKFRVKTVEQYQQDGELKERSQTHLIDVWSPYLQKDVTPMLRQGQLVEIQGAFESRNTAKQGEPAVWTTSIVLRARGVISIYGGPGSNIAVRSDAAASPKIDHSERVPPPVNVFDDDSLDVPF
jgi:single-stranded DNA-binding protein